MVNLDNIFHLFGSNDNLDGSNDTTTFIDFKVTPIYWVGMYKKLILNHLNFNKKIVNFFKKSNAELDVDDIREAGEFVTYNRAWSYIKKIDIKDKEHLMAINTYSDEYLDTSLKLGISFFIETEEYEKCAHLQKILDSFSE
jgi:hypothetical protein|tara:strand:+ start:1284 stop:1706 length:423 start_codon:yes stop_codon:yes gene_type:complete